MDYFLSSPTSTSLQSSPGNETTSTIVLDNEETYQETAITSPTNRSRHTKSEQPPETSFAASGVNSEGTIQVALQEPSEVDYATTTFTTNADALLRLDHDMSLLTTEPTRTRIPGSLLSSASGASSSSSSSESPLTIPPRLGNISVSAMALDDEKGDGELETEGDNISGFRQTPSPVSPVTQITDNYDDEDSSMASFSTASSSSTDSDSTTPTPRTPARFTAEEKGKTVDRSGREWARSVGEKDKYGRKEPLKHKRTKSTGVLEVLGDSKSRSMKERSHRRSTSDYEVRYRRRRRMIQEEGFSRDFVLLVALCVGFACAGILIVRPAILVLNHNRGDGFDLYFDM